jgi:hypothetical protein
MCVLPGEGDGAGESLRSLVYRYFFFNWLFQDVSRAQNMFERRAAWRHNQAMRGWLPAYMRRWAFLAAWSFALGAVSESVLAAPILAACWYSGFCGCVPVLAVTAVVWIFLGRSEPL